MKTKADTALKQILAQLNMPDTLNTEEARKQGYVPLAEIAAARSCTVENVRRFAKAANLPSTSVRCGGRRQIWYRAK